MMDHPFARTEILVGTEGIKRLANSRVAVFGIGGVGGYVVEALARSGVGTLDLIDHDKIEITNLKKGFWISIPRLRFMFQKCFTCRKRPHSLILLSMIMWSTPLIR